MYGVWSMKYEALQLSTYYNFNVSSLAPTARLSPAKTARLEFPLTF